MLKQVVAVAHDKQTITANRADPDAPNRQRATESQFLERVCGVVFYATPHRGAFPEEWSKSAIGRSGAGAKAGLHVAAPVNKELMDRLAVYSRSNVARNINADFYSIAVNILRHYEPLCFAEGKKTNLVSASQHASCLHHTSCIMHRTYSLIIIYILHHASY